MAKQVTSSKRRQKGKGQFFDRGKFLHDEFAEYLKKTFNIIKIDGVLHIYHDGCYVADELLIKKAMVSRIKDLNKNQMNEVLHYLTIIAPEKKRYKNHISFENWIYNIKKHQLIEHSPKIISTNKIPLNIDLNAYSEQVDIALNKFACNDKQVRKLLEEIIGYLFLPDNKYQKAFILYGEGSNGKSTFLKMVQALIGRENYSTLSLHQLNERFSVAELHNKMANFGDDIPKKFINDSSIIKQVITGDSIKAERKGRDPFNLEPYAKFIFTCNNMVQIDDQSYGLYRRLVHVPFNARFSKNDKDYDPNITEKLSNEEALQYLFVIAMQGLKRLEHNNGFTEPEVVKQAEIEFKKHNNHVIEFLEDYPPKWKTLERMYKDYCFYVAENGFEKFQLDKRELSKNIKQLENMELVQKWTDGKNRKVFDAIE